MPLPWKKSKSKSGRISRLVCDLQQSPKHGGSLVVETGFPTSLIDLFVKNRDRIKQNSSKRSNKTQGESGLNPPRQLVSSPSPSSSRSLPRHRSLPQKLDQALVTEDISVRNVEESFVGGLTAENTHGGGDGRCGGGCVLMVVVFKVFMVAVLALSTKKLTVGITLSAFALLFIELAVARVLTLLNLCPNVKIRVESLIGKLVRKRRQENLEEPPAIKVSKKKISFEIVEETRDYSEEIEPTQSEKRLNLEDSSTLEKIKPLTEEKEVLTIRDVMFKNEKSKSAKLKSKIVKKIVPKKLRSYKKKKKMKNKEKVEIIEIIGGEEEEEESVTEGSSLFSEERVESEISERDEIASNPPLLESSEEIEEEEECKTKGDLTKAAFLIAIVLAGLLCGKVLAIILTVSWCLILTFFCYRSQTNL